MSALLDTVHEAGYGKPVSPVDDKAPRTSCERNAESMGQATLPSLLILADDLSGAADCAATTVRHGARATVALTRFAVEELAARKGSLDRYDVLAIDLDSRRMSATEAAQVHRDTIRDHRAAGRDGASAAGFTRIFKKVDSTLRGHLAAEVAALAPLIGLAIVAPALPEAGRTTEGGRQLLHGIPVEESEVWRNEKLSGTADLVAMLRAAGMTVRHQSVPTTGAEASDAVATWRDAMLAARECGALALVCDAVTTADLDAIAEASMTLPEVFWVGSAGLARSLTRALSDSGVFGATLGTPQQPLAVPPTASAHGALFVVGSMSSVSHAQIAALRDVVGESLRHIEVDVADLLNPSPRKASSHTASTVAEVTSALQAGRDVVVSLAQEDRSRVGDGYRLAQAFGACLAPTVGAASAVFATGGETARALLSAASIACFTLDTEMAPGVPLSMARVTSESADEQQWLPIVTKAGAFGDKDTLALVWRHLKARTTRP